MKRKLSTKLTKSDWLEIVLDLILNSLPVYVLFWIGGLVLCDVMRTYNYTDFSVTLAWVSVVLTASAVSNHLSYVRNKK